jgi:hypothetical protein
MSVGFSLEQNLAILSNATGIGSKHEWSLLVLEETGCSCLSRATYAAKLSQCKGTTTITRGH